MSKEYRMCIICLFIDMYIKKERDGRIRKKMNNYSVGEEE